MRVHYLQHVPFEGLGSIEPWLRDAGHSITHTQLYLGESLPTVDQFDWLIVMGGPMGANDDGNLNWMGPEKQLIGDAIRSQKKVLGICLGAQLIASVLKARVFKNGDREIGWFEIQRSSEAIQHPFGVIFPNTMEVFHWHGDTFDLPAGAVRLASSVATPNQAFAFQANVLALQFHLETTPAGTALLIQNCGDELDSSKYVQTAAQLSATPEKFQQINRLMGDVLTAMAAN